MPTYVEQLLEAARLKDFPAVDREAQRRSFAYGNTHIENPRITRQIIDRQADSMKSEGHRD